MPLEHMGCLLPVAGLNESPSQKEGKFRRLAMVATCLRGLNESPSQKEGKST